MKTLSMIWNVVITTNACYSIQCMYDSMPFTVQLAIFKKYRVITSIVILL